MNCAARYPCRTISNALDRSIAIKCTHGSLTNISDTARVIAIRAADVGAESTLVYKLIFARGPTKAKLLGSVIEERALGTRRTPCSTERCRDLQPGTYYADIQNDRRWEMI